MQETVFSHFLIQGSSSSLTVIDYTDLVVFENSVKMASHRGKEITLDDVVSAMKGGTFEVKREHSVMEVKVSANCDIPTCCIDSTFYLTPVSISNEKFNMLKLRSDVFKIQSQIHELISLIRSP